MIARRMASLRASAGALARRAYPGLDARLWNRRRDRLARRATRLPRQECAPVADGRVRLVAIATGDGPDSPRWRPGAGNHFYEVTRTAQDLLGVDQVRVLRTLPDEDGDGWHERVIREIASFGATHVIGNVEIDPYHAEEWTWDLFVDRLRASWSGILLGLMYDSAFEWTTIRARRLVSRDPRMLLVALDRPIAQDVAETLAHVGPVLLPMCRATQAAIDDATQELAKDVAVSFIGALYPYRVPALDAFAAHGVPVTVNPQRPDVTRTYDESRANQPDYLSYMSGLARSELTVNFSRANTEDVQQLKTRLLEASFVGCLVATDDEARSDVFFAADEEFVRFRTAADGAEAVRALLSARARLDRMQEAARRRARSIAETVFWDAVDAGLTRSGLPALLPTRSQVPS